MPTIPDTCSETRRRAGKGPFADSLAGRELQKRLISVLASNYRKKVFPPPRGLEQVLRRLKPDQYALIALRTLLNRVYGRKDDDLSGLKPPVALRLSLGRVLRDELEFVGLLAAKKYVRARRPGMARRVALEKFRRLEWTNAECARAGDWLIKVTNLDDLIIERGDRLEIDPEIKAAFDGLAEDLVFTHPLYVPMLSPPSDWTGWRINY